MRLRPLHDRILVKRVDPDERVKGGIIIPDTAKEKPQEGVVVATGNGKILENGTRLEMSLREGDRILFGKYSGTEVKLDGEEFLIMREDDVLAVTEGAAKTKSTSK
jgi:chaperonin GroES